MAHEALCPRAGVPCLEEPSPGSMALLSVQTCLDPSQESQMSLGKQEVIPTGASRWQELSQLGHEFL